MWQVPEGAAARIVAAVAAAHFAWHGQYAGLPEGAAARIVAAMAAAGLSPPLYWRL